MKARGMTLIELMLAAAIMSVAMMAAGAVLMAGVNMNRKAEIRAQESDEVRLAMNEVVKSLRHAGGGAGMGLYVGVGAPPGIVTVNPSLAPVLPL